MNEGMRKFFLKVRSQTDEDDATQALNLKRFWEMSYDTAFTHLMHGWMNNKLNHGSEEIPDKAAQFADAAVGHWSKRFRLETEMKP